MIEYENYDSTSVSYNDTRTPIGLPIIMKHLTSTSTALSDQTVLDAGCGTGNYLAALHGRTGTLHGVEFNSGMAQVARERFADDPKVNVQQGSATDLSCADGLYDGVICNQVLHHLDSGDDAEFPNVAKFFLEAFRVLRPGGVLIINSSGHDQHRDGFWWAALVPKAIDEMLKRMPSIDRLKENFRTSEFVDYEVVVPFDEVLQGEQYLNPEGPLSAAWRAGDSSWSLASEAELAHAIDEVGSRLEDGSMAAFITDREKRRAVLGQTTFLIARKPGDTRIKNKQDENR